jgi:hypothetical protein
MATFPRKGLRSGRKGRMSECVIHLRQNEAEARSISSARTKPDSLISPEQCSEGFRKQVLPLAMGSGEARTSSRSEAVHRSTTARDEDHVSAPPERVRAVVVVAGAEVERWTGPRNAMELRERQAEVWKTCKSPQLSPFDHTRQ